MDKITSETDLISLGKRPLPHSTFFELTFEMLMLAQAFLRSILPETLLARLDIDHLTLAPKKMYDVWFKETRADVVYRVPIRDSITYIDFFIILEHKSFDDFWTILQVFCYAARICEREFRTAEEKGLIDKSYRLPPVIVIIIHHGETQFTGSIELDKLFYDLPEIQELLPKMKAILLDLSVMDESAIPSDPNVPELKAVLMILKVIFSKDVGVKAKDVFEELKPYSDNPKYRYLIRLICIYLANNAQHLKNQPVKLEQVIQTIVGEKDMSTLYELWTKEGEVKGEAKGKAEGEAKAIIRILTRRLELPSQPLQQKINSIRDINKLDELTDFALTCVSLEEFTTALN
ncbi:MAG: Rpn family recombination-promoting nuclease/putative transposase [Planctomycetaceae bacterium]|jgi:predicted transposase YdaD|nr:Rpn family recombination-promoting nuclease/putative transposase [Planctomycetaceae bacterium]